MAKTTPRGRTTKKLGKRPTEVFAARLKEVRKARGMSQAELAERATQAGVPLGKLALMRIENGQRGVSLDEMVALTELLGASPAHMLCPDDGEWIALHDNTAVDGSGLRFWLRTGDALLISPEGREVRLEVLFVAYARALVDASRSSDKAGIHDAVLGILDAAKREEARDAS